MNKQLFAIIISILAIHQIQPKTIDVEKLNYYFEQEINSSLLTNPDIVDLLNNFNHAKSHQKKTIFSDPKNILLFNAFPILGKKINHISLGNYPTQIKKLSNLEKQLDHHHIYIKRDDLSAGTHSNKKLFGGNKVRKLEFLLADAITKNANTIITLGDAGSNHAVTTAAYSEMLNLKTIYMLSPQEKADYVKRNLKLGLFYNAKLHIYPSEELRDLMIIGKSIRLHQKYGIHPYIISSGGSSKIGMLGYVNAAFELKKQIKEGLLPEPDYIYVPFGSMGTALGLILGLKAAKLKSKVIPVSISDYKGDSIIINALTKTNSFIHSLDPSFPLLDLSIQDIGIRNEFVGSGYACFTPEGNEAISLLNETESITLDGTYSAKAFAAMIHDIRNKQIHPEETILFWNTYCSENFEKETKEIDYHNLPSDFYTYFED